MSTVPMTKEGAERLEAELNRLKGEDRPAIINAISEARAHGDLKENAEYHAAKEKQSFIEGVSEISKVSYPIARSLMSRPSRMRATLFLVPR